MHVETQSVPSRRLEWTVLSPGPLIVLKTNSGVIRGNIGWRFDTVSGEQPGGTLGAPRASRRRDQRRRGGASERLRRTPVFQMVPAVLDRLPEALPHVFAFHDPVSVRGGPRREGRL